MFNLVLIRNIIESLMISGLQFFFKRHFYVQTIQYRKHSKCAQHTSTFKRHGRLFKKRQSSTRLTNKRTMRKFSVQDGAAI